jgi:hypothetical protein
MSLKPNLNYDHGYAILRHDDFVVTVKKILWDYEEAAAEVKRLNDLKKQNGLKNVHYSSQGTRVARRAG